jgi:uncharacterized protein with ParB-like and HNH nuclease domain
MAENKIETPDVRRNVKSLLSEPFYVPKYQRGYRWTEKQVEDLLNDIDRFTPSNDDGKNSWYCLQPLVVKQGANNEGWRLIDGQQRLTTIRLILHNLNIRFPDDERIETFPIKYETREKNLEKLNIKDWLEIIEDKDKADTNIDFQHIYNSYQHIKDWMTEQKKNPDFKVSTFRDNLLHNCKFIWYDIDQNGQNKDKEEDVFIRLNDGKIPLANSELIKALFLNSFNFAKDKNEEEIRLRQLEISTQWDIIEQELSDNELWYFINGKENLVRPRIEYIFDVIANKPTDKEDGDFTFRYFQSKFEDNENKQGDKAMFVKEEWENILNTYLIFKEWFKDKYYYHHIGYLLCMNYKVADLLCEYKNIDKNLFKESLSVKIKKDIVKWNGQEDVLYKDKERVRKILLLHNVITMLKQGNETARFPFFHYIGTKGKKGWDIEHIQARAEEVPKKEEHRKDWISALKDVIKENENLRNKINSFSAWSDDNAFNTLFEEVTQYFENNSKLSDNNENLLSNLTLLDAGTNRGYGNEFYPVKRKIIIQKDKEGVFIPVCTKKVFLKYYSQESPNMTFWNPNDREAYLNDIKTVLTDYLTK